MLADTTTEAIPRGEQSALLVVDHLVMALRAQDQAQDKLLSRKGGRTQEDAASIIVGGWNGGRIGLGAQQFEDVTLDRLQRPGLCRRLLHRSATVEIHDHRQGVAGEARFLLAGMATSARHGSVLLTGHRATHQRRRAQRPFLKGFDRAEALHDGRQALLGAQEQAAEVVPRGAVGIQLDLAVHGIFQPHQGHGRAAPCTKSRYPSWKHPTLLAMGRALPHAGLTALPDTSHCSERPLHPAQIDAAHRAPPCAHRTLRWVRGVAVARRTVAPPVTAVMRHSSKASASITRWLLRLHNSWHARFVALPMVKVCPIARPGASLRGPTNRSSSVHVLCPTMNRRS